MRKPNRLSETDEQKAIRLLQQQINRLNQIPEFLDQRFVGWFATTKHLLTKFLGPDSNMVKMFDNVSWTPRTKQTLATSYAEAASSLQGAQNHAREVFNSARGAVIQLLNSGIEQIEEFGVAPQGASVPPPLQTGNVYNTYHGPVTIQNQANATNEAIQHAVQSGRSADDLTEITKLLQETMQLTGHEVNEGLKAIADLALELKKPQTARAEKTILERGNLLLSITTKMVDLKDKLIPHLPTIVGLVEQAAKHLHK